MTTATLGKTSRGTWRWQRHRAAWSALPVAIALASGALVATLVPCPAQAQVIQADHDRYKTPQHFAFEFRLGPYTPNVDSEFDGRNMPYREFFGSKDRLMTQVELDYQFLRHMGSAGIGLGVGYFSATGNNRSATGTPTADTSTFKLIPFSLSAVYRFDLPYEQWKFPLVPYGKLGLDYAIWSVSNGNGDTAQDPTGGTGRGGTWGWHAAVGLSLVLDIFDPVSAHQFDVETGVNHTHLFAELGHWDISGLGSGGKLHVGDNTWLAGLMFEF